MFGFRLAVLARPVDATIDALVPGLLSFVDMTRSVTIPPESAHGTKVAIAQDLSKQDADLAQEVEAEQPELDLVTCPGRVAVRFSSGTSLKIAEPAEQVRTVYVAVFIPASSASPQVAASQDTSASTTKPAWELQVG